MAPDITMPKAEVTILHAGLNFQAQRCGEAIALRDERGEVSFSALDARASQVANGLRRWSLGPNDRVAIIARDSIPSYELLFGCSKAGCVLVPINWRLTGKELHEILVDSTAKTLFVDEAALAKLRAVDAEIESSTHVVAIEQFYAWRNKSESQSDVSFAASEETPLVQIYTSGTTGMPKGVVLAHRTFFKLLNGIRRQGDDWMGLGTRDVLLLSLPQFHIGGLWWAVQGLMAGSCGMLVEQFVGWKVLKLIEQHRITQVAMVPAMIQFILSEPDLATTDLSSVRGFLYGGSPIAATLLERAMEVFRCPFYQIYGMTETGNTAVCLRPKDHDDRDLWQAAGRPYYGVELKVVGAQGTVQPPNSIGEIWIKSPSVMLEYWKNPDATAEVRQDGWIRTGDAGYVNDQGYLFVCDRVKDMTIYAGENVYPAEIESVLLEHPAIAEAAVIGIPDQQFGERVKAILVAKPEAAAPKTRELLQHCRGRLADFKIPKSFEFVDSIPRNPSGKILKHILRKPYWENHSRQVN